MAREVIRSNADATRVKTFNWTTAVAFALGLAGFWGALLSVGYILLTR